jgi:hypothetical protein
MFQISAKGEIQKDSSHLRESAIDAAREASEIQHFAKNVAGVAEKTHKRHVTLNHSFPVWTGRSGALDTTACRALWTNRCQEGLDRPNRSFFVLWTNRT